MPTTIKNLKIGDYVVLHSGSIMSRFVRVTDISYSNNNSIIGVNYKSCRGYAGYAGITFWKMPTTKEYVDYAFQQNVNLLNK